MQSIGNAPLWRVFTPPDFRAVRMRDAFAMYAQIPGGEVECFKTQFPPEDMEKINREWMRLGLSEHR